MGTCELYQGDCLEVMKGIPDNSIDMVLTDPPYGTTVCKWDSVIPFEPMWEQIKRVTKDNGAIVLTAKEPFASLLRVSNIDMFKYDWVWRKDTKSNFPQASFQPLNNLEYVCVFSKGYARNFPKGSPMLDKVMIYNPQMSRGKKYKVPKPSKTTEIFRVNHSNGVYKHKDKDTKTRFPYNTLEFNTVKGKDKLHPTQKPVSLMEYLVKTYTNSGETVLDFTMGSGTTGVSCKNLGRSFIGIELDESYFNIAKERINGTPAPEQLK